MYRISLLEKLLIRGILILTNFTYSIIDKKTSITIKTASVTGENVEITLDLATFNDYTGKTLLLQITKGGYITEEALFLISGIYENKTKLQKIIGFLGENRKDTRSTYQDGNFVSGTIKLYTSNTLITELESLEHSKSYVTNFTPDYRYHTQKQKIVEE